VENVSITFNDSGIGTTDSNGELIYTPIETGKFKVTASKSGYQDASKYIDITDPNARLEYSNLTIEPKSVQPGEDVNITVVASNLGTFRDTDTITLKVNGEEVMTKDLDLDPGESTTIEYSLNRSEPGTYVIEVNGQSDTFNVTGNEGIYLDFTVTDAVLSHDGEYLYLSSKPDCKLYIVNLTTGTVDKISFSNMTESLTINPRRDAIYLALLTREHDGGWWDEDGREGYIAEIDPETRSLVREFRINEDPYDIVATSDGYLYVSSGSGQWTNIRGYDLSTTSEVGSASIRHRSHIKLHPDENCIYSANTDLSPSDIEKFDLSDRSIQALYDSPYHGDYPMSGDLEISPDGTKIFTRSGHIFRSTESQATDMTHIGSLGSMWNSLTFDEINNVYTVSGTSVMKYNCDTYEAMGGKSINGNGRFIFYNDGYLIVVTEDGEFPTKSSIQIIDVTPTPPASVTNLNESAVGTTWINWTWTDPADFELSKVMVYLDGVFQGDVNSGVQCYNATLLTPGTTYEIGTLTVDTTGNINQTWVNHTAITASTMDTTPPVISSVTNTDLTADSVTISWITDENSDSVVRYGTTSGNYTNEESNTALVTLHNITLSKLSEETTYYYMVYSTDASGNTGESSEYNFTRAVISDTTTILIGDTIAAPNGYAFTSIIVDNVTNLGSGNVNVTFDPSVIQVIDVTSGDGNVLTVQDWDVDNTAGSLEIAAWDANDPHNGDVIFANLTLHSIGDHLSSTPLAISSAELTDYYTYEPITHTVANGTLDIIAPDIIIGNVKAAPGEYTTALVMVNNASNLGSGNITVTYNSSVVHLTNVTSGDGNALAVQDWNADNTAGSLEIAAWDADESHNGDVVFANVTFHAVGEYPDSTPLTTSSTQLIDYTSYSIIGHSVTNGTFSIIDNEPPVITDAIATPDVVLNDNGRLRIPGTNVTVLNATVQNGGSGVANVTIDLSRIGGSDDQVMERIAGTDVWTLATTATDGINLTHELVVTATDGANNTNTSVIELTVLLRGDVVRDGDLNSADALYIAKYLVGKEDMHSLLVGDIFPADGDGKISTADALYLAKYLVGKEAAP